MKNTERALLIEVKSLLHELSKKERELTVYFFELEDKDAPKLSEKQKQILQTQNSQCTPFFQKIDRVKKAIEAIINDN